MRRPILAVLLLFFALPAEAKDMTILNVSYDPTREFYADYNRWFTQTWQQKTGQTLRVRMSHGGSGKQARAVIDGLQADVVSLALGADTEAIAASGLIRKDWQQALPHASAPYRSVIVLLVRKGNPKNIHDWNDLARDGVKILTPNPKTSGGARWNYLAAWAYAETHYPPGKAERFMKAWLSNVIIFDTGARGATTNFVRRRQGDVLITWENEAHVARKYFGEDAFEIVMPGTTMLAEPPVALVDSVADARGTRDIAQAYLRGLYAPEGQALAARHFFRPVSGKSTLASLDHVKLVTADGMGGWEKLQKEHFAQGGSFDQYTARE